MTKVSYTEEEIQQILRTLFLEKKKIRELEQQLHLTELQCNELKKELGFREELEKKTAHLSESHQQAQQKIEEGSKKLEKEIITNQELAHKLTEAQTSFLDAQEENSLLIEQQKTLKTLLIAAQKEAEESKNKKQQELKAQDQRFQQQLEKLQSALHERDKRVIELAQYEQGFKKIQEQMQLLEKEHQDNLTLQEEKKQLNKELVQSRDRGEQLERVIKFLRERSEEAHLEANQLQGEFHESQEKISLLKQQLKSSQEENEQINQRLLQEQQERRKAFEELTATREQFEQLETRSHSTSESLEKYSTLVDEVQRNIGKLDSEKNSLEEQLKEKNEEAKSFEKELSLIRDNLDSALAESREMGLHYHTAINEKTSAQNRSQHLQQQIEKQRNEIMALQDQLTNAKAHMENLKLSHEAAHQKAIVDLQHEISFLKQQLEIARQNENAIVELNKQIAAIQQEKQLSQEKLIHLQQIADEKDAQLKMAQQHMAKKVRETHDFSEKIEEQRIQLTDLHNNLASINAKSVDWQHKLEMQKRIEYQLQESLKAAEAQITKWEEKYFQMCNKWQETEARNKELKKLEERQGQLQSLLSSLNSVLEVPTVILRQTADNPFSPPNMPSIEPKKTSLDAPQENPPSPEISSEFKDKQQSLFDPPKPHHQYKQNFFDS